MTSRGWHAEEEHEASVLARLVPEPIEVPLAGASRPARTVPSPYASALPPGLDAGISRALRWGVAGALVLLAAGLSLTLALADPMPWTPFALPPVQWLAALGAFPPEGLLLLGFACLVATPLARVLLSALRFGQARDRAMFAICLTVLGLLGLTSLAGALL